jgi:hypothetical protein
MKLLYISLYINILGTKTPIGTAPALINIEKAAVFALNAYECSMLDKRKRLGVLSGSAGRRRGDAATRRRAAGSHIEPRPSAGGNDERS